MALYNYPFQPVPGAAPAFNATVSTAAIFALEATGREYPYPSNRLVRLTNKSNEDYHVQFGSSTVIATVAGSPLVLGGVTEVLRVDPRHTHISIIGSSTDVSVNVALGHGGY